MELKNLDISILFDATWPVENNLSVAECNSNSSLLWFQFTEESEPELSVSPKSKRERPKPRCPLEDESIWHASGVRCRGALPLRNPQKGPSLPLLDDLRRGGVDMSRAVTKIHLSSSSSTHHSLLLPPPLAKYFSLKTLNASNALHMALSFINSQGPTGCVTQLVQVPE